MNARVRDYTAPAWLTDRLSKLFGTVTHAYRVLNLYQDGVPEHSLRRVMKGQTVRESHGRQVETAWRHWAAYHLMGGAEGSILWRGEEVETDGEDNE
jgi:hypothetical protein